MTDVMFWMLCGTGLLTTLATIVAVRPTAAETTQGRPAGAIYVDRF